MKLMYDLFVSDFHNKTKRPALAHFPPDSALDSTHNLINKPPLPNLGVIRSNVYSGSHHECSNLWNNSVLHNTERVDRARQVEERRGEEAPTEWAFEANFVEREWCREEEKGALS